MDFNYQQTAHAPQWSFDLPPQQQAPSAAPSTDWAAMAPDAGRDPLDTSNIFFASLPSLPSPTQFASAPAQTPFYSPSFDHGATSALATAWFGNGHPSPTRLQPQQAQLAHHAQTIDPATFVTMQSNHHHYSPSMHPVLSPAQQQQQQLSLGINPTVLQLPSPPTPSSTVLPAPDLLARLRPHLTTKVLENASGAKTAVRNIVDLISEPSPADIELPVRKEVMSRIRDAAGSEFLDAWVNYDRAMTAIRVWLKSGVKDAASDESNEVLIATLMVVSRLKFTVELLKATQIGRLIKHISNKPPSNAIKSVAQNLESQWRDMISKQQLEEDGLDGQDDADSKQRKRKQTDSATSRDAPPAKKQALLSSPGPKVVVKKEPVKASASTVVKDAKSDTSFFSAPKAKPKLPSFTKKAPPPAPASNASSVNVAQPMSSLNPFADALKSIDKSRNGTPPASVVGAPPASAAVAVSSPAETAANKKRRVTFAPDDRLVAVRWIERAIYDDDADGTQVLHDVKDLDRAEGAAMHQHVFEEAIDWFEPEAIDVSGLPTYTERGQDSEEKATQEERESKTLEAIYASEADIPHTPAEAPPPAEGGPEPKIMLCGSELDAESQVSAPVPQAATVHDLLGQLASTSAPVQPMLVDSPALPPAEAAALPEGTSSIIHQLLAQYAHSTTPTPTPDQTDTWSQWAQQQQQPAANPPPAAAAAWPAYAAQAPPPPASAPQDDSRWGGDRGGRGRGRGAGRGGRGRGPPRTPCRFFLQGTCRYGDHCDFLHER